MELENVRKKGGYKLHVKERRKSAALCGETIGIGKTVMGDSRMGWVICAYEANEGFSCKKCQEIKKAMGQ